VDTHLKVAGELIDPRSSTRQKLRALVRAAGFYLLWYPRLWLGLRGWFGFGSWGRLAPHIRFCERKSRKLARTLFHCMVRFGPGLEKRQMVLGRLVDIGAELLAMSAVCAKARQDLARGGAGERPLVLADLFCRRSRRRVHDLFEDVFFNDDRRTYRVAQQALAGEHAWLERGIVR
jgi:hypothetical protein